MKLLKKLIVMLAALHITSYAHAEIISIKSIAEAQKVFDQADADTLYVTDVDMVLNQPENPALQMKTIAAHKGLFRKKGKNLKPLEFDMTVYAMVTHSGRIVVEQSMVDAIKKLQEKRVKIVALTAILAGTKKGSSNVIAKRYDNLKKLGFNFDASFPKLNVHQFTELQEYNGNHPIYYKGVISANGSRSGISKGDVLKAFLKLIAETKYGGWKPKQIIFIDDLEKNVKVIEEAVGELGYEVKFTGIHYKAALAFPKDGPAPKEAFTKAMKACVATAKSGH